MQQVDNSCTRHQLVEPRIVSLFSAVAPASGRQPTLRAPRCIPVAHKSVSLEYKPSSVPLHISALIINPLPLPSQYGTYKPVKASFLSWRLNAGKRCVHRDVSLWQERYSLPALLAHSHEAGFCRCRDPTLSTPEFKQATKSSLDL